MKRDLYVWKDTYICVALILLQSSLVCFSRLHTRRETYIYEKRPIYMKRELYMCSPHPPAIILVCFSHLHIWKETYIYEKRPMYVKRELYMCSPHPPAIILVCFSHLHTRKESYTCVSPILPATLGLFQSPAFGKRDVYMWNPWISCEYFGLIQSPIY